MNQLKEVVNAVLEQQKLQLAPSTYDARKNYLKHLVEYGDYLGIQVPCQELYVLTLQKSYTKGLLTLLTHRETSEAPAYFYRSCGRHP